MCGRFFVALDDPELMAVFRETEADDRETGLPLPKAGTVFPGDYSAAVVFTPGGKPHCARLRWGFSSLDQKGLLINARAETVLQKATFKDLVRENRCLIPASYYFEWKKDPNTGRKLRHIMRDSRSTTIYMAGLFRQEEGETVPRYVILTRDASKDIQHVHHRMPVILDPEERKAWLSDQADVSAVLNAAVSRITALEDLQEKEGT